MSYNGSGTFVINTAGQPVVSGTVISSTAFNALTADLATGLSTAITKDGQTTPTANIPMGNNKITGLAVGTAATDAANLSQVQSTAAKLIASVSGADTITGTLSPTLGGYAAGQMFYFVAAGDNTAAVTLNINSLGAKSITRDGTTALIAGDIKSGEVVVVVYDGTQFQMVNAANSFSGNVTAAKFIPTGNVTAGNGMYLPTTNTVAFSTNGTEALRIDASQNLGLGVTPSAWGSNWKALDEGLVGCLAASSSGSGDFGLVYNAYNDNTNWRYKYTGGAATRYRLNEGIHAWFNAPSGTAGNTITFTQAMTLDASGRLGVGSTSPDQLITLNSASTSTNSLVSYKQNGTTYGYSGMGSDNRLRLDGVSVDVGVGTAASDKYVWFYTNNTERARITSGGYSKFSNNGTYLSSTASYHEFYQSANAEGLRVYTSDSSTYNSDTLKVDGERATTNSTYNLGNFRNGNGTGQCIIRDSGNVVNTNNSYGQISDIKTKQDVVDAASQWDDIKGVRVRKFRFKNDPSGPLQIGVVAQELEQVSPGLVNESLDYEEVEVTDEEGNVTKERQPTGTVTKSVKYSVLYMKAIKALQEAMARIEQLEAKVAALETK